MPNSSAASARKRRSWSSLGRFLCIHCTARSYQTRALFLSPSCHWTIARKNQSKLSPPLLSSTDFSSAALAACQSSARQWATPSVFQHFASLGANATALRARTTASFGSRNLRSAEVASSRARALEVAATLPLYSELLGTSWGSAS